MEVVAIITGISCFILSIGAFVMSAFSFKEKGFLFNNAYLYASKAERETMDKKPYYHQSAIVFLLIGIMFLLNALSAFFLNRWFHYMVILVAIITVIYAIASSITIEKQRK